MPLFIRVAVAVLLISSGFQKFGDPVSFLKAIREYDILPPGMPWLLNFGPNTIPLMEIAAGLCILTGFLRRGAAFVMGCFLVLFTAAIIWRVRQLMIETGSSFLDLEPFNCGCGSGNDVVAWEKISTNLALIIGTFYCMFDRVLAAPSDTDRAPTNG